MKNSNTPAVKKLRPTALVLAMSFATVLTGCKSEVEPMLEESVVRPVYVEIASDIEVAELSFSGAIQSASRADLSFKTSGRLVEMLVQEGDRVEYGQRVAKLDDLDAQIALTSAKVELDNARAEYLRAKKLFESRQSISKSQFEELTLRFNLAQNRFDEANHRLDDTRLTAPFSGVVSRTFIDNHTLVQSNEVILSLHDLDDLEVVIDVPESLMTRNEGVGKTFAQSTVAPYSVFEISLKKYETEPDPISGTYAVTFAVDNKEQSRLLPGMSVHVYSDEQPSDADTIQIPLTSVNPDNLGNKYIWVVDDKDIVHKRTVFTGSLNGERVEIKSNLQRGEKVVVSGTKSLHEGQVVRPQVTEVY